MTNTDIQAAYVGLDSVDKVYLGSEVIWPSGPGPEPPLSAAPLTLEIISGGTIWWQRGDGGTAPTAAPYTVIYYSKDFGRTWSPLSANTGMVEGESYINVNAGDKVQFAGTNTKYDGTAMNFRTSNHFAGTAVFNAYGNILSMHDKDNYLELTGFTTSGSRLSNIFLKANVVSAENLIFPDFLAEQYTYTQMFYGCTSLTTAPELPATTLAERCYYSMFQDCTSLTQAPALPATTLANYCYSKMFHNCTNLTTAPELPATELADNCYLAMFYGCTSLTPAPVLPATAMTQSCYSSMFNGCTSLTSAPVLSATTLANSCYSSMFNGCTSLTQAPVLPATTLIGSCYSNMFNNCTHLTTAPALPATTMAGSCYQNMFYGCTSLTTAPELPATTLAYSCYRNMFYGCTSLTTAPELPATTLANSCYYSMFQDCTSLTQAPALPATTLAARCYYSMFYGCTSLATITCLATNPDEDDMGYTENWTEGVASEGTFYKAAGVTWPSGDSGIPDGWTVIDADI